MTETPVRDRLVQDIALWQADGLIPSATATLLRRRYEQRAFGLGQVMRSLGTIGLVFIALGILGLVAAAAGSETGVGVLLLVVSGGAFAAGITLTRDELGRYPWSSKFVLTVGAIMFAAGVGLLLAGGGMELGGSMFFVWGLIVVPVLTALAYVFRIPPLLTIAVLALFHWIGSWTSMWGQSTYEFQIQDPKLMAVAALVVFGLGLWHERAFRDETGRFYRVYQSVSLVYFNMSLLILTIEDSDSLFRIALFTAAAIGQIVAGARLQNRLLVGFGVTFLFIDGFTRFYETFWDTTSKGLFFLIGGVLTFAAGAACEWAMRHRNQPS